MIQVDLAMSYGFGAGLALAAGRKLTAEKSAWNNRYFIASTAWFATFFVPHAMYFIAAHPAWHTMFVVGRFEDIPPWVVGGYALGIFVLGCSGFFATQAALRRGRRGLAFAHLLLSAAATLCVLTYGWDGTGFQRFVYAGSYADWQQGVAYPASAFFRHGVFATIAWILPAWAVPYLVMVVRWVRQNRHVGTSTREQPAAAAGHP